MEAIYFQELCSYDKSKILNDINNDEKAFDKLQKYAIINNVDGRYQFKYVGVIIIDELIIYCYPKYITNTENIENDFKQAINVIKKYNNFHEEIDSATFDSLIEVEQQNAGIVYVKAQKNAIFQAISNGVLVLTGGPGTGKTTILKAVVSILEQRGLKVAICAPTGRAAKRLFEMTGKQATTIHRLLGVCHDGLGDRVDFVHDQSNLLKYDVVVVDEMSMVDCLLFSSLLKALKSDCRLILTGDCNQLPSVSAGNVLKNLVESRKIITVKLNKIFRQAAKSLIVKNAHAVVSGKLPVLNVKNSNFFFFSECVPIKIVDLVVELVTSKLVKRFAYTDFFDIQVICLFKKGVVGTINLNKMLQAFQNLFLYIYF